MSTVKYVVGSERERWLESSRTRTGWHDARSDERVPEGLRHAVDADTATSACGVPTSSFVVFDDLDWMTMLSNEMCAACKRAAR